MAARILLLTSLSVALTSLPAQADRNRLHRTKAATTRVERTRNTAIVAVCAANTYGEVTATCIGDAPKSGAVAAVVNGAAAPGRFTAGRVTSAQTECPAAFLWTVTPADDASAASLGTTRSNGRLGTWLVFGGDLRQGARVISTDEKNDSQTLMLLDRDGDGTADIKLSTDGCDGSGECISLWGRDGDWKLQRRFQVSCQ